MVHLYTMYNLQESSLKKFFFFLKSEWKKKYGKRSGGIKLNLLFHFQLEWQKQQLSNTQNNNTISFTKRKAQLKREQKDYTKGSTCSLSKLWVAVAFFFVFFFVFCTVTKVIFFFLLHMKFCPVQKENHSWNEIISNSGPTTHGSTTTSWLTNPPWLLNEQ